MNIKALAGTVLLFLLTGCGCSDDEIVNFDLNEFESSAMPIESQTNIQFVDNEQKIFDASISGKTIEKEKLNPNSNDNCMEVFVEEHENKLKFQSLEKEFTTSIEKRSGNKSSIVVFDGFFFYGIDGLDTENLEEELMDININGFDFNNVFVLNSGGDSGVIIYSPSKGIVFIKNNDGSYLKRTE